MVTPTGSPFWNAVMEGKFEDWLIPSTIEGTKHMVMNVTGMTEEQSRTMKNRGIVKGKRGREIVVVLIPTTI